MAKYFNLVLTSSLHFGLDCKLFFHNGCCQRQLRGNEVTRSCWFLSLSLLSTLTISQFRYYQHKLVKDIILSWFTFCWHCKFIGLLHNAFAATFICQIAIFYHLSYLLFSFIVVVAFDKLSYFLQRSLTACCFWYTVILLWWLIEDPFPGPGDEILRGFLNVGMFWQVTSLTITLFYINTTIVDEFGKTYKSNDSVIENGNLFRLDIVWRPGSLYFIYIWLYFSLLFQHSIVLCNQLISHIYICIDFLDICLVSLALIIIIWISFCCFVTDV